MLSLGVDIGGSHIAAGIFDFERKALIQNTYTHTRVNPKASKDQILSQWSATLQETINKIDKPVKGIGIAMPGPFDYYNGISKIQDVDKFQSLYNVNLRSELAVRLNINPSNVRFINDASAFSIAEALLGQASKYDKVVAITLGTGLGASFVVNAKPIIEDTKVPQGGFLYNQYYRNQLADEVFSTRGITNSYFAISGVQLNEVKSIAQKARHERDAQFVFEDFGEKLGEFLKPFLKDFGAETLVLGGNISKAFQLFENTLKMELSFLEKIYVSELGEQAAIIGSALLLEDNYYNKLKETLKLM
ncbi:MULTISPECIES: ROK family protein [unclassified Leeuwenhoekiella]|uniref:ROK family protein n=1 Tax=unclassified Leeuwenhoekiella TaxID=2615029 RepID=UPI000C611856|nr:MULTISPECIES: ROK family protein [unclassified Leeuwenhoekiella]MAW95437.1 sugar kinase [Leeuwenhoekiella sp.]MBA80824.1 sugar kinase [Leeuwenhoekiella sp.]|tara:strand:+ start:41657 stop:42568 length:912 start_codon:yes stop_codon:yes gene_type:complete